MTAIHCGTTYPKLEDVLDRAKEGPLLLLTADGREFCLSEVDDFDHEVDALRNSQAFQKFLDERASEARTIPLDEIEREIQDNIAGGKIV
jgi:hypothetical protein